MLLFDEKGCFRQVHLGGNVLHPGSVTLAIEQTDTGWIALKRYIGKCVDLEDFHDDISIVLIGRIDPGNCRNSHTRTHWASIDGVSGIVLRSATQNASGVSTRRQRRKIRHRHRISLDNRARFTASATTAESPARHPRPRRVDIEPMIEGALNGRLEGERQHHKFWKEVVEYSFSEDVCRTPDVDSRPVHDVGVDHCHFYVLVVQAIPVRFICLNLIPAAAVSIHRQK